MSNGRERVSQVQDPERMSDKTDRMGIPQRTRVPGSVSGSWCNPSERESKQAADACGLFSLFLYWHLSYATNLLFTRTMTSCTAANFFWQIGQVLDVVLDVGERMAYPHQLDLVGITTITPLLNGGRE